MTCQHVCDFLDAYLDRELDLVTSSQFERHLVTCVDCRSQAERYRQMHDSVRERTEYFEIPPAFEQKLRLQLFPAPEVKPRRWLNGGLSWALVTATVAATLLITAVLLPLMRGPARSEMIADQVVSSHIRSLLANHLSDVVSTDQHTVKPWFIGKLDFAPVVKDLASQGFPLTGGRLDYLNDRPVAALIYKRRQHTINLFEWPSTASDSAPGTSGRRGYNFLHWTHAHMTFWAVSDLNTRELGGFVRAIEE